MMEMVVLDRIWFGMDISRCVCLCMYG
jgi:hypothetical protein